MAICAHAMVCKFIDAAGRCPDEDCQFFIKEEKFTSTNKPIMPACPNCCKPADTIIVSGQRVCHMCGIRWSGKLA